MQHVSSPSGARRHPFRRVVHTLLGLAFLSVGAASGLGACSSEGDQCVGGVVVNGVCEGKCKPELCAKGNTCVGNRCVLKCDSHADCYAGTQECGAAKEDDTHQDILICKASTKGAGFGAPCPFGTECQQFGSCPDGTACNPAQCGGKLDDCKLDETACKGKAGCSIGKCASKPDESCTVATCSATQCKSSYFCQSAGEGDANAYCTKADCQADSDCPGGYECGIIRDPHEICGTNPPKGNNSICGTTTEKCIDPATFGQGNTYMEGSICLLRKACVKRAQCSACKTDLDCSLVEGQRCLPVGGENHCVRNCKTNADCTGDYKCTDGACIPRFNACKGKGGFCEPCQNDTDCGDKTTTKACASMLTGQHGCFDYSFPMTCMSDGDCPKSPGMIPGKCLDQPGSQVDHHCYLPIQNDKEVCYPPDAP